MAQSDPNHATKPKRGPKNPTAKSSRTQRFKREQLETGTASQCRLGEV